MGQDAQQSGQGRYPGLRRKTFGDWARKQARLWYSADRIRDHVAEPRQVVEVAMRERVTYLRTINDSLLAAAVMSS